MFIGYTVRVHFRTFRTHYLSRQLLEANDGVTKKQVYKIIRKKKTKKQKFDEV